MALTVVFWVRRLSRPGSKTPLRVWYVDKTGVATALNDTKMTPSLVYACSKEHKESFIRAVRR